MKRPLHSFILFLASFAAAFSAGAQGTTTSSMNGQVIDNNGEPVIGATVVAVHEPSGSQYANVTNQAGQFRLPNMRVGGPYTVTFSFVGYESVAREDVFLDLGQTYGVDVTMRESVTELADVVVSAGG